MNCLSVADVFRQEGCDARVMTAVDIQGVGERYDTRRAVEYLESGKIVRFACGTGSPFFSTDTAAVLRAAEVHADAILLAKNIDGVYSDDPRRNPDAVKYDEISYADVLAQRLAVMDSTATSLAMDNDIPVIVFALAEQDSILRVLQGEKLGTLVK
jgi:uridylate kinase